MLLVDPASIQDQEIEAGAGIWLVPLGFDDLDQRSVASPNAAWTDWVHGAVRLSIGGVVIPSYGERRGVESLFFGHITLRRRWIHDDGGGFSHVRGRGWSRWLLYAGSLGGESWPTCGFSFLWHVEALTTRRTGSGCRCALESPSRRF